MLKWQGASALLIAFLSAEQSFSAIQKKSDPKLTDRLEQIRDRVTGLEQELIDGLRSQKEAATHIRKMHQLLGLQKQERELSKKRLDELTKTVSDLELRRETLASKISEQQLSLRRFLVSLQNSMDLSSRPSELTAARAGDLAHQKLEAPTRKALANLIDRGLKEVEALKVDLADAERLEARIQEEKQQLAYIFQDLSEQEGLLALNQQVQLDLLKKKRVERLAQLESYRKLKASEIQVETLIRDFNARLELERANEAERSAARALSKSAAQAEVMASSEFLKLKGRLRLPVTGKIVSQFGKSFDERSQLNIFKKGIEISTGKKVPVRSIYTGKVVYSGELPEYGRVTIVDHGDHYYSLCARLGDFAKRTGDSVAAGDVLGSTDDLGTPVYFEIRARNIAVNPLQWVSN